MNLQLVYDRDWMRNYISLLQTESKKLKVLIEHLESLKYSADIGEKAAYDSIIERLNMILSSNYSIQKELCDFEHYMNYSADYFQRKIRSQKL